MNKREIAEIKRRFKKESCTFTRVCGCYVNSDKAKVVTFRNTFLNLEDEELHKYLEIANKTLSGKPGNSLLELPFPMEAEEEGGAQALLMELRSSQLKDDEVLNRFYDRVIETYDKVENYLILLFHDAYDVPMKTTDNLSLDDSEEVFESLMCAICPVDLSKPGLGYNENENRIGTLDRDWVVGAPESGFTFPCFTERSTDIHAVMVYTKDAKQPHTEFWENGLGCKAIHTSTQKKMAFTSILGEALGDPEDEDVRDTMREVQQGLSAFIEIQTETQDKDEPVFLNREELSPILENSGIDEPVAERIADKFDAYFEENLPEADELLDAKSLKDNGLRMEKKELEKQVVQLNHKLEEAGVVNVDGSEVNVIVKVPDDRVATVRATFVDGQRCIVIPLEGDEETTVNGEKKVF